MNLALTFAAILTGAIVVDYGVKSLKTASASPAPASATPTVSAPAGNVGQVTRADIVPIASAHRWDSNQISAWEQVITKESGGNPKAINPSSGAAGIAQFINGFSEYAQYGGSASSVGGQLTAMANYIKQRYGSPSVALAHENAYGWY